MSNLSPERAMTAFNERQFNRRLKQREEIYKKFPKDPDVYFRICALTTERDLATILPWDKIDRCAGCSRDVYYDSRESEGKVHVCTTCVKREFDLNKMFNPLSDNDPTSDDVGRPDMVARQQLVLNQNAHQETRTAHTGVTPVVKSDRSKK
jgi:hypothetical protein